MPHRKTRHDYGQALPLGRRAEEFGRSLLGLFRLTTQAQRRRPRGAPLATMMPRRRSLQRMVRGRGVHRGASRSITLSSRRSESNLKTRIHCTAAANAEPTPAGLLPNVTARVQMDSTHAHQNKMSRRLRRSVIARRRRKGSTAVSVNC